ncbi:hypothetical protein ISCGN_006834 [Ixodes scapularis]
MEMIPSLCGVLAGSPTAVVVPRNPLPVGQLVHGSTDPRRQREESGSASLPGVAASTRRRATCSVNNGSDGRSPILNAKAKPRRVDKKGRRRKDVTFAKAYRNNRDGLVRGFSVFTTLCALAIADET